MKQNLILLFAAISLGMAGTGCKPQEQAGIPPVCMILSPEDGAVYEETEPIEVRGDAAVAENAQVVSVVLSVNGAVAGQVNSVPFTYTLAEDMVQPGELEIVLSVTDSNGQESSDEVTITVNKQKLAPQCSITSPGEGTKFEVEDEIRICGEGSDPDGSIEEVSLTVNGAQIAEVSSVPFDYVLAETYKAPGMLTLVLKVTDDTGLTASDTVEVEVLGQFREFTDSRDGKTYKTVKIGEQIWFAENLAYLPSVNSPSDASKEEMKYYVYGYYGEDVAEAKATENYQNLGVLYNWLAAGGSKDSSLDDNPSGIQGACPEGWHLPSEAEWQILYQYVRDRIPEDEAVEHWDGSMVKNVCGHLRSKEGWPLQPDDDYPQLAMGGFDTYGFCAKVSGACMAGGFYYGPDKPNTYVTFWLPHYDDVTYPSNPGGVSTSIKSYQYEPDFSRGTDISRGHPVRCVQD